MIFEGETPVLSTPKLIISPLSAPLTAVKGPR